MGLGISMSVLAGIAGLVVLVVAIATIVILKSARKPR